MSEKVDVVLWGCTGFTGRLVAEYFAHSVDEKVSWALAGRNHLKLEALRRHLIGISPRCRDLKLIIASIKDQGSLCDMARQARVILSTCGPFLRLGTPVVRACVTEGTHYCDITGELPWVRQLMDEFHEEAVQKKVHIVPSCGFDSIPADLGSWMVAQEAKKTGGARWIHVFSEVDGDVSGGTVHSLLGMYDSVSPSLIHDPALLDPPEHRAVTWPRMTIKRPQYNRWLRCWTGPFIMAEINTKVVRRSALLYDLRGESYGPHGFHYVEGGAFGSIFSAWLMTFLLWIVSIFFAFALSRAVLRRILPSPGMGPSRETRQRGWFRIRVLCETIEGRKICGTVAGSRDPGYTETAKMVAHAALCLLDDENLREPGGVLTPATSMGAALLGRLRTTDQVWDVETL